MKAIETSIKMAYIANAIVWTIVIIELLTL